MEAFGGNLRQHTVTGFYDERAISTATPTPVTNIDRPYTDTPADPGKTERERMHKKDDIPENS